MSDASRGGVITGLPPGTFTGLFHALDALRNLRAFVALLGCLVVGVLLAGVFSLLASRLGFFFGFLGGLSVLVASAAGLSAAGVLLMDQARGLPSRPLGDALVYGLMCIPKFILLALTLWVVLVMVFIAIAVVYGVCMIPVLGPLLFVVAFPVSVVVAALALCGSFLCMSMSLPAIWEGAPILRAITQSLAVARNRGVETLLMLCVVGMMALGVGLLVSSALFAGLVPTVSMAAGMLGGEGLGSMLHAVPDAHAAGDPSSYALAAGIGGMLLWALAGTLLSLVYLLGLNIVYLRVTEGLDIGATEQLLRSRFEDARRQAAHFGQKARDAAERAREQAARQASTAPPAGGVAASTAGPEPQGAHLAPAPPPLESERPGRPAPPESTSPAVAKAQTCPHCLSGVAKDDVFCPVCGYRL